MGLGAHAQDLCGEGAVPTATRGPADGDSSSRHPTLGKYSAALGTFRGFPRARFRGVQTQIDSVLQEGVR